MSQHASRAEGESLTEDAAKGGSLGRMFAEALARKDFDQVADLLQADIDFRGLTPGRTWEAADARAVVDDILSKWFEESDELERLAMVETDSFADRERIAYRFEGRNSDGPFVVEQQAYYTERDGRLSWMRVLCSGFRPRSGATVRRPIVLRLFCIQQTPSDQAVGLYVGTSPSLQPNPSSSSYGLTTAWATKQTCLPAV